jgi:selenide,water dikinase
LKNCSAQAGDVLILGKPLGVGIFSAALKREVLSAEDYWTMIASTTLLNRPGAELGAIRGVHAVTDVTGFGLAGHLLEMCRGSGAGALVRRAAIPIFPGARRLAMEGVKTGASTRNWASVSGHIDPPPDFTDAERDLLTDPQTSGGLLVSCTPDAASDVLALFNRHGHAQAAIIGEIVDDAPRIQLA